MKTCNVKEGVCERIECFFVQKDKGVGSAHTKTGRTRNIQ